LLTLTGRTLTKTMDAKMGLTLLEHALKSGVDWSFNCSQGTCARCRCLVPVGSDLLAEPTDAEWDRLGPDELDEGYRLGCQAAVVKNGALKAVNKTYF
jgi:ferredoxin, 2Fe-2S